MFVLPHSVRPRRASEQLFEGIFAVCMIANVAGFVIAFADFYDRQKNTFEEFFGDHIVFRFATPLSTIFQNCSYTSTFDLGSISAVSSIDVSSAPMGFLNMANFIMVIFILHGVFIVLQGIAVGLHSANTRHFRIGGSFIPVMTLLPCLNCLLCVALIALIWGSKSTMEYYNNFVAYCATEYIAFNQATFLEAEYDTNVVFGLNLDWIFAPVVTYLAFLLFAVLHHLSEGMRPGFVGLAKSQFPWEQGFMCRVSKAKLAEWTRRRARLMEELERGSLMLVSPFPLFATASGAAFVPLDQTAKRQPSEGASNPWRGPFRGVTDLVEFGEEIDPEDPESFMPAGEEPPWADEPDVLPDEMTELPHQGAHRRHRRKHRRHREDNAIITRDDEANNEGEPRKHRRRRHRHHDGNASSGREDQNIESPNR